MLSHLTTRSVRATRTPWAKSMWHRPWYRLVHTSSKESDIVIVGAGVVGMSMLAGLGTYFGRRCWEREMEDGQVKNEAAES